MEWRNRVTFGWISKSLKCPEISVSGCIFNNWKLNVPLGGELLWFWHAPNQHTKFHRNLWPRLTLRRDLGSSTPSSTRTGDNLKVPFPRPAIGRAFPFRWLCSLIEWGFASLLSLPQTLRTSRSSLQSASDLNLRVLEPGSQTSEFQKMSRHERPKDPFFNQNKKLGPWQASSAETTSQYLVGTCCQPSSSRAPASYDPVGNGVTVFQNLLLLSDPPNPKEKVTTKD